MAAATTQPFTPPAIPWLAGHPLQLPLDLGPGLDAGLATSALERLCSDADVAAVVAFGSRGRGTAQPDSDLDLAVILRQPQLSPLEKRAAWSRLRQRIGPLGVGLDLVVAGAADAERLSQSRWHVFGDVAREGLVLYVAG